MKPVVTRTLGASLLAGLMAAPTAVVLWPIALLVGGKSFDLFDYLRTEAFAVAVVAAVFGWVACVVVGWPLLVLLSVKGLNRPALVACIGGALAGVFFALVGAWPVPEAWPLYAYFTALGAACGAFASRLSSAPSVHHSESPGAPAGD
jgi:hypothetical protein